MKALTVRQPWATLVAIGAKAIETRSWGTRYRGPLAIHAASAIGKDAASLCIREPFRSALIDGGYTSFGDAFWAWASTSYVRRQLVRRELPLGRVLAVVNLVDCRLIEDQSQLPGEPERSFGDYRPGRWMWCLRDPVRLVAPVPARGRLGLWEWEPPDGVPIPDVEHLCPHFESCAEHERCGPRCSDPRTVMAWGGLNG